MTQLTTTPEQTLSRVERIVLTVLGTAGLVLLVVARNLEPDPRGFGTHEQLGLTPCTIQQWTGQLCPTCGATTAWAHALRGHFAQAVETNLGCAVLLLFVVTGVPWSLISAAKGRWLLRRPAPKLLLIVGTAWMAVLVFDWLRRTFLDAFLSSFLN